MASSDFASAEALEQSAIPVIDMADASSGTGLESIATRIHAAATRTGFFYIAGHGIDAATMQQAFSVARDFFALPVDVKQHVAVGRDQRGWMASGMSRLQGSATHDLKEVFFWGTETTADDPDLLAGKPLIAENRWPTTDFPRLEIELRPYYNAVCEVARRVMAAIATSLDIPADSFERYYEKPLARGQLVYYPPSSDGDESEQRFGVAPHTDFGVLTMLLQDDNGGLQVQLNNGEWVEAPPIPGTLVCNIGDLLQRWSNDRFRSTRHRVINRSGKARYSIPVFFDPHTDTLIDPCMLGVDRIDSRYEPVLAGEHIADRNRDSFAQHRGDIDSQPAKR